MVDPDGNFEKFLIGGAAGAAEHHAADLLASPDKQPPPAQPAPGGGAHSGIKPVILPPTIRPQHVYAPMPALGALSLGLKGKKRKSLDEDADFSRLMNGAHLKIK